MGTFAQLLMTAFAALLLCSASEVDGIDKPVPNDLTTLLARSEALEAKGQFAEAERMIRRFLTTETILPVNKIFALNSLGALMMTMDRFEEAEKDFERALDLAEHNPAIVPLALVRLRFNLAAAYLENHRYQRAQNLLSKVSEEDASQPHERWRLASLRGTLAILSADYERGKQVFESHLRNLDSSKPTPELAITLNNLGMVGLAQKDYAAADRYLEQAAAAWRAISEIRHSNLAWTLVNLAIAEQQLGNNDGAQESLKEALRIARTQLGDAHPFTAGIYEASSEVLTKLGSKREAKELKRIAQRIRRQPPSQFPAGAVVDVTTLSAFP